MHTVSLPNLDEATLTELQDGLSAGFFTSVDLVKAYLARIAEANPLLKAVISTTPTALEHAAELDAERQAGRIRGMLHGIPIGVKDNIATRIEDGMDTTAGSFALQGAVPPGDAGVVTNPRAAGAIVLCKTNLSVWANYRGVAPGAWSPVGGQSTHTPSGSSSGSAVAAAVGLCAVALGTETNGSIVAPANFNALCAVRPTVGLVSQAGVVPITHTKDTVGPMARSVIDAAHLLQAMVSGGKVQDEYVSGLEANALNGQRLIVPQNLWQWNAHPDGDYYLGDHKKACFEEALSTLQELGANVQHVDVDKAEWNMILKDWGALGLTASTEFKADLETHLREFIDIPSGVRSLDDLITFTKNDVRESPPGYEGQPRFEKALKTRGMTDPAYIAARANQDRAGRLIADLLSEHSASAAIMPNWQTGLWGQAGWPQVIVPLGYLPAGHRVTRCEDLNERRLDLPHNVLSVFPNQPFGITFAGAALTEATLLSYAYAFEQATQVRKQSRPYAEAMPKTQLKDVIEPKCAA